MPWYLLNIGDAMLAGDALEQVEDAFRLVHEKAGHDQQMALFIRHESDGGLHCQVKVYFSPACASVAKAVGASPCAKPSTHSLGLLAGSDKSRLVLFDKDGG